MTGTLYVCVSMESKRAPFVFDTTTVCVRHWSQRLCVGDVERVDACGNSVSPATVSQASYQPPGIARTIIAPSSVFDTRMRTVKMRSGSPGRTP